MSFFRFPPFPSVCLQCKSIHVNDHVHHRGTAEGSAESASSALHSLLRYLEKVSLMRLIIAVVVFVALLQLAVAKKPVFGPEYSADIEYDIDEPLFDLSEVEAITDKSSKRSVEGPFQA